MLGDCDYKAKTAGNLRRHKADAHGIGVVWHHCDVGACDYKAKRASTLRQHKADAHDIGVVWHHCGVGDCDYKAKTANLDFSTIGISRYLIRF